MIYVPGTSLLHRLHPLTKLALALLLFLAVNLLHWEVLPAAVFVLLVLVAVSAGVARPLLQITFQFLLPVFVSLFVIQGVLFPPADATPFAAIGPVRLTYEGFTFAFVTATRLLALSVIVLLVVMTTHPADLSTGLTQIGVPRSIVYVLLVALQLAPDMTKRGTAILEAQQSRGLEVGRGIGRIRALPALVGPLIVGALSDVEERAMAIESRAFLSSGPKTVLRSLHDSTAQLVVRWCVLVLCLILVIARFTILRQFL